MSETSEISESNKIIPQITQSIPPQLFDISKPYKKVEIIDNNINSEEITEENIYTNTNQNSNSKILWCCNKVQETIKQGSLLEGIFNLSIFTLGIGLLALPQKVRYMSLFMTPMIIISGGIINYWTLIILSDASRKYKLTKYEDAVTILFNQKFSYFFSFIMCVNQFGTIIAFQIIIYKFLGAVVNQILSYGYENMENFAARSFWGEQKTRMFVCYSICYIILFPLCLTKTLSKMRFASTFGVLCQLLMIFIILIQFPSYYYHNIHQRKQNINFSNIKLGFGKNLEFFQSITTIIYAFECHAGVFSVLSSLQKPSKLRVQKVFSYAILIDVISCLIIALSGYLSQPFNTPEIIIERHTIFKHDILMITGLILFIFTLITKVGANYSGFRITILNLFKYDSLNYPNSFNIICTFFTLSLTTFITAFWKKNIIKFLNLAATFCSIVVVILIPGMIYIKGNNYPLYHYKNIFAMIFIFTIVSIGLITMYCFIHKFFSDQN